MTDDPFPAALRLASIFEDLGIDYWLGGSLASSIHGEPRSTHDVDFVVDLELGQCDELLCRLEVEYFVDADFVHEAVRRRDCFQVVQRSGYNRVDVFVKRSEPFADEQQRRRQRQLVDPESGGALWVTTAEDIVLQKLVWYRKGGEVSDLQWRDVLGVLKANQGPLRDEVPRDRAKAYLDRPDRGRQVLAEGHERARDPRRPGPPDHRLRRPEGFP